MGIARWAWLRLAWLLLPFQLDADCFYSTPDMSSKDDLKTLVPILDGSNWCIWEIQMTAYLRSKGLWQLVTGADRRPADIQPIIRTVRTSADGVTPVVTEQ